MRKNVRKKQNRKKYHIRRFEIRSPEAAVVLNFYFCRFDTFETPKETYFTGGEKRALCIFRHISLHFIRVRTDITTESRLADDRRLMTQLPSLSLGLHSLCEAGRGIACFSNQVVVHGVGKTAVKKLDLLLLVLDSW